MNLYDFSKKISNLKKQGNYAQALQFFKENKHNFQDEEIKNNKWLISNIITCLRKTNQSRFIHTFLQNFNIQINENTEELILNAYGWCLYDNIKNKVYSKYEIIDNLQYPISLLSRLNSNFSYTIISNILREGFKIAKEYQNQDYNFTNDFCNLFDKNILSVECNSFEINGKTTEQASDQEKWYSEKSKSLFELKKFQECFELSKEALEKINNFHNNNDLWFARRIALSKKELGNIDDAITDLEVIYKKKRDWFIQKEISELYFDKNDIDNAFKNAILAINNKGKLEFKIGLIFLLGKILKIKNEAVLAYQHFLLVKKVREENQWKLPDELMVEINNLKINDIYETKQLIKNLKQYWTSFLPKKEIKQGKIKKILNDNERGKNGFIYCNDDEEYYFTIPSHINFIDKIEENIKVSFEVIQLKYGKEKAKIIKIGNI